MDNHPSITKREWAFFAVQWFIFAGLLLPFLNKNTIISQNTSLALILLVVSIILNLVMLTLFLIEQWSGVAEWGIIIVDALLIIAAIGVGGSGLIWLGLIPAVVAGLYFDWLAGLLVGLMVAGGALVILIIQPLAELPVVNISMLIPSLLSLLAAGSITALISKNDPTIKTQREKAIAGIKQAEKMNKIAQEYVGIASEMADVLSSSQLDPRRVLRAVTSFSLEGMGRVGIPDPIYGAALLFTDSSEEIESLLKVVQASSTISTSDKQIAIRGKEGVINLALQTNEPIVSSSPAEDPELSQFESFGTFCKSVAVLPMRAGNEQYGVLLIGCEVEEAFNQMHLAIMRAIANQAAASIHNAQLYGSLVEQKDRLVEVEKAARAQLASDLHDGPTQGVAAITMRLNFIRKLLDRNPEKAAEELYQIEEVARRTTKEIRHMLFELRPKALEEGLSAGLEQLAAKNEETYEQKVEVAVAEGVDRILDEHTVNTLFSIAMETINNARKHAQAEIIHVQVGTNADQLIMEISDNGRGFDVDAKLAEARHREGHLGLLNLFERVQIIDGVMNIQSAPGQGTRTIIRIPLATIRHRKEEQHKRQAEQEAVD